MSSYYQLACTIISLVVNAILMLLIVYKSSKHVGKYKYLMIFTAVFEIVWGLFDLPAEVESYSHGYVFLVFRVNHQWSWLTETQSTWVVVVYTAIFGASLAIFAGHFIYRYASINKKFRERYVSGWKFGLLFTIPLVFGIWWALSVAVFCDRTQETDDYSRESVLERFHEKIEDLSYISALYYGPGAKHGSLEIRWKAWIGAFNMLAMVLISMLCVFIFGCLCYHDLYTELSELGTTSLVAKNLHKQLFYSLVIQTTIPIVFMHIPMCFYLLCPMLNLDNHYASDVMIRTVSLYPAIDPLPSFFIIANYRNAVMSFVKRPFKRWAKPITNNDAQ